MADPSTLRFWLFAVAGGLLLSLWWHAGDLPWPGAAEPDPSELAPPPGPAAAAPPRAPAPAESPAPQAEPTPIRPPEPPAPAPPAAAPGPDPASRTDYGLTGEARLAFDAYHRAGSDPMAREEAIFLLAMEEQPEVLDFLLDEFAATEAPEERASFVDAIIQFGSNRAVGPLRQLAARTESAEERMLLLEAAEYLSLPEMTEMLQEQKRFMQSESEDEN